MTLFYLPDLGEGLPDAEIRKWHIHLGDVIKAAAPMLAVETAKAIVDIPAPFSGKVIEIYAKPGEIVKTGEALLDIEEEGKSANEKTTLVGSLQTSDTIIKESALEIKPRTITKLTGIKATPAIRALAKKMQLDLACCVATGPAGQMTVSDLENAAKTKIKKIETASTLLREAYLPLPSVRRTMARTMSESYQAVVPVSLVDDADIDSWPEKTDITLRLIRAIMTACQREPRLNSWFDGTNLSLYQHQQINLGIAMDASEGLFVPVLKDIARCSAASLRKMIDQFKLDVKNRSIPAEHLSGATFVLSNVGVFAGRYATPLVLPPTVAILAAGRITESVVASQGKPVIHKLLPLSLTVDHRAITGGEAARFLSELIRDLQTS